jgi:alpha-1,3-rhamnosyl/mannosyltransferase
LRPSPDKVRVVPLATSSAFQPHANPAGDATVWGRYGLTPGYVLYVGGFWPHKNVPQAIRAHAALPPRLRKLHPLILAGGPLSRQTLRLLREPRIAETTRYLGPIPEADLPTLYRGATLFLFPSHYEGFGLPVLEAMASGTPVLCSTAPALVELTSGAAEHVDPEDDPGWKRSLSSLLEDPERRAALAARGRARSGSFTPERMTRGIFDVLDDVLKRRR